MSKSHDIKQVAKHGAIYGLANILNRSAGIILIPLYVHLLTPQEYGLYAIVLLLTELIAVLVALGMGNALVKFYIEANNERERRETVSTVFAAYITLASVFLLLVYPIAWLTNILMFGQAQHVYLLCMAYIALTLTALFNIELQLLLVQKKSWAYTWISLLKTLLFLATNIWFVAVLHLGVLGIVYGTLISSAVMSAILLLYVVKKFACKISLQRLRAIIRYTLPLIPATLLDVAMAGMDRFFLHALQMPATVGYYALADRLANVLRMLLSMPFAQIWVVRKLEILKQSTAREQSEFNAVFVFFIYGLIAFALGMSLFAEELLYIIAAPEYAPASQIIPILALVQVLLVLRMHFEINIFHQGQTQLLTYASTSTFICAIPVFYVCVTAFGAMGAACALAVVHGIRLGMIMHYSHRISHETKIFPWIAVGLLLFYAIAVFVGVHTVQDTTFTRDAYFAKSLGLSIYLCGIFTCPGIGKITLNRLRHFRRTPMQDVGEPEVRPQQQG